MKGRSNILTKVQVALFEDYNGDRHQFVTCASSVEKTRINVFQWELIDELTNDFRALCHSKPDKLKSAKFQSKLDTWCKDEETKELIRFVSHYISKQRMSRTKALDHSRQADVAVRLLNQDITG